MVCFVLNQKKKKKRSPSVDIRFHGLSSIPIASFVECLFNIKSFHHCKYLNCRTMYSSDHRGTFNPKTDTPHAIFKMKELPSWQIRSSVIWYQIAGEAFSLSYATSTQN